MSTSVRRRKKLASGEDPFIGRLVLARYRVVGALAQGGMGVVYLGRTEGAAGFSRPVAIKRVLPQLLGDPAIGQMFIREARILANLQHPGIVGVVDFGEEDDAYIMVLEYVHGYDVQQWLGFSKRKKRLIPIEVAVQIAIRVLDALHYAHTLKRPDGTLTGVIHRDISPSNILLDLAGHVRLSDFGIARIANEGSEFKTLETTFKGKVGYAHPDLVGGGEPTPFTDVYSAAVVLFQLLCGVNPFRSGSLAETLNRVLNAPLPRLSDYLLDTPPKLEAVLLKGMSRRPEAGFRSARDFADALLGMLTRSQTELAAETAALLQRDFVEMPAVLNLETLESRDAVWRNNIFASVPTRLSSTPPPPAPEESATVFEGRRVDDPTLRSAPVVESVRSVDRAPQRASGGRVLGAAIIALALLIVSAAIVFYAKDSKRTGEARYVVVSKEQDEAPAGVTASTGVVVDDVRPASLDSTTSDLAVAGEPTSTVEPPPVRLPPTPRKPDSAHFTRVFAQRQALVQSCFTRFPDTAQANPNLEIAFTVDSSGDVTSTSLLPSTLANTALGQCVLRVARGTKYGRLTEKASFRIPVRARLR